MTTAQSKEIRAFCATIDMETPRTVQAIITDLRNHYKMFWFDEDKVRHTLIKNGATSFTLGNNKEYFYLFIYCAYSISYYFTNFFLFFYIIFPIDCLTTVLTKFTSINNFTIAIFALHIFTSLLFFLFVYFLYMLLLVICQ